MPIFSLSYHSRNKIEALTMDSLSAMNELLFEARSRNLALNVTGALFFNAGRFTQVLEGEEKDVKQIFKSIEADQRHDHVSLLSIEEVEARRFEKWSMAFVGKSAAARRYYSSFVEVEENQRAAISSNALCKLMLELIELDHQDNLTS